MEYCVLQHAGLTECPSEAPRSAEIFTIVLRAYAAEDTFEAIFRQQQADRSRYPIFIEMAYERHARSFALVYPGALSLVAHIFALA